MCYRVCTNFCKEGKGGHLTNLRISFAAIGGFGNDFGLNSPTPQLLFSTVQTLSQIRHGCSSQTPPAMANSISRSKDKRKKNQFHELGRWQDSMSFEVHATIHPHVCIIPVSDHFRKLKNLKLQHLIEPPVKILQDSNSQLHRQNLQYTILMPLSWIFLLSFKSSRHASHLPGTRGSAYSVLLTSCMHQIKPKSAQDKLTPDSIKHSEI